MKTQDFKIGMRIQCMITYSGEIIEGVIIGFGYHKGNPVIDLDCNRFVYLSQVIGVCNY
jgi:hypothetical protein